MCGVCATGLEAGLAVASGIRNMAEPFDIDGDRIAILEELLRVAGKPNAFGRTGHDDVTGVEGIEL